MSQFDWPGLLRAGMSRGLGLREVWALTPAELAMILGRGPGPQSLTRSRLEELAAAFPDMVNEDGNDGQDG